MKKMINITIILRWHIVLGFTLLLSSSIYAQSFFQDDKILENEVNNFLVEYENGLNSRSMFEENTFLNLFYNDNIEVLNDFCVSNHNDDSHISIGLYVDKLKQQINDTTTLLLFFHHNLEVLKVNNYNNYDVIHVKVLKEKRDYVDCTYPTSNGLNEMGYEIEDACSRVVDSTYIVLSLLYKKYADDRHYQILRISEFGEDLIIDNWYKPVIPETIRIKSGINFFELSDKGQIKADNVENGYQFKVSAGNAFFGGRNYSIGYSVGLGYSNLNRTFSLDNFNEEYPAKDKDSADYKRISKGTMLSQNHTLSFFELPLGITFRYFPFRWGYLEGAIGFSPWLLNQFDFESVNGTVTHEGQYSINGYPFQLTDIPEYGFSTYLSESNNENPFKKFGVSWNLSAKIGMQVTKAFDVFVSTQFEHRKMELSKPDDGCHLYNENGLTSSIMVTNPEIKLGVSSFSVGLCINLQNTSKPFVNPPKFKSSLHDTDTEELFLNRLAQQMPKQERDTSYIDKFSVNFDDKRYSKSNVSYYDLEKGKIGQIKTDNGDKVFDNNVLLIKSFGEEIRIAGTNSSNLGNLASQVCSDSTVQKVEINDMPPLDIFITINEIDPMFYPKSAEMINSTNAIDKSNRERLKTALFYAIEGANKSDCIFHPFSDNNKNNIKSFFEETKDCTSCQALVDSLKRLGSVKSIIYDYSADKPIENILNEIRAVYFNSFVIKRREVNVHFFINDIYGKKTVENGDQTPFTLNPLRGLSTVVNVLFGDTTLNSVGFTWDSYIEDHNGKNETDEELQKVINFKNSIINASPTVMSDFSSVNVYTTYDFSDPEIKRVVNDLFVQSNNINVKLFYQSLYNSSSNVLKTPIQFRNIHFKYIK